MQIQVATVVCDRCGFETDPESSLPAALAQARLTSWQVSPKRDLCAQCRPGPEPPVPSGLAARLRTIGAAGHCWCGQPVQHGWEGKAAGQPHPR